MALVHQRWTPISYHEMIYSFLRAEADLKKKWVEHFGAEFTSNHYLINEANFSSKLDNFFRFQLLCVIRGGNLETIPPSTEWFYVEYLMDDHLSDLYMIAQRPDLKSEWDESNVSDPGLQNKLIEVAKRCSEPSKAPPEQWDPIILWGHSMIGPFTIIEGNHRLLGYCSSGSKSQLKNKVIIGLSREWCILHRPDRLLNNVP